MGLVLGGVSVVVEPSSPGRSVIVSIHQCCCIGVALGRLDERLAERFLGGLLVHGSLVPRRIGCPVCRVAHQRRLSCSLVVEVLCGLLW